MSVSVMSPQLRSFHEHLRSLAAETEAVERCCLLSSGSRILHLAAVAAAAAVVVVAAAAARSLHRQLLWGY